MPHGYTKTTDNDEHVVWTKTHKNGARTKVDLGVIPNSDRWFGFVDDTAGNKELGTFNKKSTAKSAAKKWMGDNPKGLAPDDGGGNGGNAMGGVIPGLNGASQSNDFFG